MPVRVKPYHEHTVTVDGGAIRLRLARMTVAQFEEFNATFAAFGKGRGNPARHADPENETDAEARERVAAEVAYLQRNAEWTADVFRRYVRVVEGDLVREAADGSEETVTDGAVFAELYAAEAATVLAELWTVNGLTDAQKKTLRSLSASATGSSSASSPEAPGPRPETTATSAAGEDSAPAAGVTDDHSDRSSGEMDRCASEPVLSGS